MRLVVRSSLAAKQPRNFHSSIRIMIPTRYAICLSFIALASVAAACNIPVFRYALERWRSDGYEFVVVHADNLSTDQSAFVDQLAAASSDAGGTTNLTVVKVVDANATVPKLAVRIAMTGGRMVTHWHCTLDEAMQTRLLDSPKRRELAKRLLAGDSVVWLMLRSSDEARTKAVRDLLKKSFETLNVKIKLPEGIGLPGSELHSEVPLVVKFSMIEIEPADAKEQFLVRWLSEFHSEAFAKGEPLLVPVFGRGRALEVIPAEDLSESLIEDLTLFLSGACSCQVKEQNPGFDLLMSIDWDTELYGPDGLRPPPAKTIDETSKPPVLLTIPTGKRK